MDNDSPTIWFALARAVHFGACLLLFGVWVFDRFVAGSVATPDRPDILARWRSIARPLAMIALPAILLSGLAWFVLAAINISPLPPRQALQLPTLRLVWNKTHFGNLWKYRAIFCIAAAIATMAVFCIPRSKLFRAISSWTALIFSGLLAVSLAWAGHAQTGRWHNWHMLADALHLLTVGFWPVGLLPFAILLFKFRRMEAPDQLRLIPAITRRYSAISLTGVSMLTATGLVNSTSLICSMSALYQTAYGRVLSAKIIIFVVMVAIGAVNLLYLKPRLANGNRKFAAGWLQFNVVTEVILAIAVVIIVAILGLLPPMQMPQ